MQKPLLRVQNLNIFSGDAHLVKNVSFEVQPGEIVGIVGESGSGKTLTSLAVADLLPRGLTKNSKQLEFADRELTELKKQELSHFLGTQMAMIFQDPMSSLNPAMKIGQQLTEGLRAHQKMSGQKARSLALKALDDVHIKDPQKVFGQHPYELSGGMRQRVMIAMGLLNKPSLLIADEPTTALDVTVQAQVMRLLSDMNKELGTAIMLISHNIALLSEICQRVLVMYRGELIDSLSTSELLSGGGQPYTRMLISSVPDLGTDRSKPLATIADLTRFESEADRA